MPAHESKELHRVPARSSNHARPPWNRLRELHRVPARRGLLLLARSVLITRWNSNQVPWDPSRELHRVPARRGLLLLARSALIARWESNQVPWDPWLCIRSPNVCRRLHTFTPCLPTSAYVHPMFADVCIRSPHVCRRLQTSGLGILGCASCWPWDP